MMSLLLGHIPRQYLSLEDHSWVLFSGFQQKFDDITELDEKLDTSD